MANIRMFVQRDCRPVTSREPMQRVECSMTPYRTSGHSARESNIPMFVEWQVKLTASSFESGLVPVSHRLLLTHLVLGCLKSGLKRQCTRDVIQGFTYEAACS